MREYLWKPVFDRLPLTDRVTYYYELWAALFIGVFMGAGLSLVSIIARRIGMSSTGITVMLSMPFVGNLCSIYFGHRIQERRDKMPFVFWPGVTSRLAVCLTVFVTNPRVFLVVMSFYYFVSTIPGPAYASIMSTNYSDSERGRLMKNIRILRTVISALFAYGAGLILDLHPDAYRWLLPLSAVFGIAGSIMFRKVRVKVGRTTRDAAGTFLGGLKVLKEDKRFLIFMGLFFLCAFPGKLAIPLEPIWFVDELDFDYRSAGLIVGTLVPVVGVLGYILWAKLLERVHPLMLLSCMFLLGVLRYPILALATEPAHVIPASIVSGLDNPGFELIPLFVMIRFARDRLPLYVSFHSTLVGVRGIIGPFIGNALYAGAGIDIATIFWIITAMGVVGVTGMFVFAVRQSRRELVGSVR